MWLLPAIVFSLPVYLPAQPWGLNFAAPPRIPLVGDVDADGFADLICVYPPGDSIIDVSPNVGGMKTGRGYQALVRWGQNCQAAVAGEFDGTPGADVIGIFDGHNLRLAHALKDRRFQDVPDWIKLPTKLGKPVLLVSEDGKTVFAGNAGSRSGFLIDPESKTVKAGSKPRTSDLSKLNLPANELPRAQVVRFLADMDSDGDQDVVEYRYGKERHTAFNILVYRCASPGEQDADRDGLTNDQERPLGSDPQNPDTDGDGLLDGWEVGTFRDFDFKAAGCSPTRTDIICLLSRFDGLDEKLAREEMDRAVQYYTKLDIANPDGSKGWSLQPVWLNVIEKAEQTKGWPELRDKYLPSKWRGIVHWMQLTPWGGGQADDLGDGGGCGGGKNTLFATFVHEFGHQLGMDHTGFWGPGHCPIYRSLMNYAYSYSLEDDPLKVSYSRGELKDFVLQESELSEVLPLPYERARFLEKGPYRYRLKQDGDKTLIDWNWNGVFGEKRVRADINYGYSTSAGLRDHVDKTHAAPAWVVHRGDAYLLYVKHDKPADKATSPDASPEKPGALYLRKLIEPKKWTEPAVVDGAGVTGDPVGISLRGNSMLLAYPTARGLAFRHLVAKTLHRDGKATLQLIAEPAAILDPDPAAAPTLCQYRDKILLLVWNPATKAVSYRIWDGKDGFSAPRELGITSTIPVGAAVDTVRDQLLVGLAQDQDDRRKSRWQVRRFELNAESLKDRGSSGPSDAASAMLEPVGKPEWVEGEPGHAAGNARCTLLFEESKDAGPNGRIYFFAVGMRAKENPWQCGYVAMQIADTSVRGGWLVKRYYDEWTQSRSSIGAAWFKKEILYAYRWVDGGQGPTDNNLHVGYRGSGIDPQPMGDFDDVAFMKSFGIRHSILWMNP
jgi:hypothetical protein